MVDNIDAQCYHEDTNSYSIHQNAAAGTGHMQVIQNITNSKKFFCILYYLTVAYSGCYKAEGRGFDSRLCHWDFSMAYSFQSHNGPDVTSSSDS